MSTKYVDLWYPSGPEDCLDISLCHVRAARDIRVHYDFERDGYVVSAQRNDGEPREQDETWHEVAFVSAWHEEPDGSGT